MKKREMKEIRREALRAIFGDDYKKSIPSNLVKLAKEYMTEFIMNNCEEYPYKGFIDGYDWASAWSYYIEENDPNFTLMLAQSIRDKR